MISVMENDIYSSISLSIFTVLLRLIFDIVQYDMAASLIHLNRGGMYWMMQLVKGIFGLLFICVFGESLCHSWFIGFEEIFW